MYNRRYDKVFLMLRQETAGYGMGQRTPWGSCVMEIKNGSGRLCLTVQGLRPLLRGRYAVYVMGREGEAQENIFCGAIVPDGAGRAELKWDFDPEQMGKSRLAVEDLHTVAIVSESAGGFSVPLTAYFAERTDWRPYFKGIEREKQSQMADVAEDSAEEIILVAAEAAAPVAVKPPKMEEKAAAEPVPVAAAEKATPQKAQSYHGNFRGLLEKFRQELTELQDAGVFQEKDMERIEDAGRYNAKQEAVQHKPDENGGKAAIARPEAVQHKPDENGGEVALSSREYETAADGETPEKYALLMENTEIYPFGADAAAWYCISPSELALLEDVPQAWAKDFFMLLAMRKYKHLIWRREGDGYLLGIPGTDTEADRQKGQTLGLTGFHKLPAGEQGYWLWQKK